MCYFGPLNIDIANLFNFLTCLISKSFIPVIFAVGMVMFVWGVVQFFIIGANEEAKRTQGKQFILWGIIAFAVMVSVWGLVRIVGQTFDLNTGVLPGVTPDGSSFNLSPGPTGGGNPSGGLPGGGFPDNTYTCHYVGQEYICDNDEYLR